MEIQHNIHLFITILLIIHEQDCHLSISGNVKALKDCWVIGDKLLAEIFPFLQQMKTDAIATNSQVPYLYEYYNIFGWFQSPVSTKRSVSAKILNSLTKGFNKIHRMPKYVIIFMGKDVLDSLRWNKNLKINVEEQLKRLINNVNKVNKCCREDLKAKHSVALAC